MKTILGAVALLLFASSLGQAQVQVNFIGQFQVFDTAGNCPDYDPTGSRFHARFRPVIPGTANGSEAKITLFTDGFALGFRTAAGNFGETPKRVETISLGGNFGSSDSQFITKVSFEEQKPPTIAAGTTFIQVTGTIAGWDFMPNCDALFRMSLQQRVE